MGTPRDDHTAVRLLDGRVLVLGGSSDGSGVTSAQLYDPLSGTWTATASMANPREGGATLLHDGRVLVGDLEGANPDDPTSGIHGAEIYDPQSGTWTATGKMVSGGGCGHAASRRQGARDGQRSAPDGQRKRPSLRPRPSGPGPPPGG